jgi:Spy/CpxP family protein refolding chaperone
MIARLFLLAALLLPVSRLAAESASARTLPRLMPAPEFALEHADEIHLTPAQREKLASGVRELEGLAQKFSEQARRESDTLAQLLAKDVSDETAVTAQFEKVLAAEDEVKRVRLKMSLQTRTVLTAEQLGQLAVLQNRGARPRTPAPAQQELVARMERLKELIERAKNEGRDLSAMREVWKRVDQLTREGKTAEASRLLEETAQTLENSLATPPAAK